MDQIIPFSETPEELLAEIAKVIQYSSIALIKITNDGNNQDHAMHIGSGTLVSIDQIYGILTAQHVARELDGLCSLGLTIGQEGQEVNFKIEKEHLNIIEIGIPDSDEFGPDLSFITIPLIHSGTIKASKFFYPLLVDREYVLQNEKPITDIWCISGTPEVMTVEETSTNFDRLFAFCNYCSIGGIPSHFEKDNFDYTELDVDYKQDNNIPIRFQGISGGGLWQVKIISGEDNILKPSKFLLSGVVFWQSSREGDNRKLRCHGIKSIYERAINAIQKEYK